MKIQVKHKLTLEPEEKVREFDNLTIAYRYQAEIVKKYKKKLDYAEIKIIEN